MWKRFQCHIILIYCIAKLNRLPSLESIKKEEENLSILDRSKLFHLSNVEENAVYIFMIITRPKKYLSIDKSWCMFLFLVFNWFNFSTSDTGSKKQS